MMLLASVWTLRSSRPTTSTTTRIDIVTFVTTWPRCEVLHSLPGHAKWNEMLMADGILAMPRWMVWQNKRNNQPQKEQSNESIDWRWYSMAFLGGQLDTFGSHNNYPLRPYHNNPTMHRKRVKPSLQAAKPCDRLQLHRRRVIDGKRCVSLVIQRNNTTISVAAFWTKLQPVRCQ